MPRYANKSVARKARSRFLQRQMGLGRVPNPNVTRGMSHTDFRTDRLGKGLLDRCGRPQRRADSNASEATIDELNTLRDVGERVWRF